MREGERERERDPFSFLVGSAFWGRVSILLPSFPVNLSSRFPGSVSLTAFHLLPYE